MLEQFLVCFNKFVYLRDDNILFFSIFLSLSQESYQAAVYSFSSLLAGSLLLLDKLEDGVSLLVALQENRIVDNLSEPFCLIAAYGACRRRHTVCFHKKDTSFLYSAAVSIERLPLVVPRRILEGANLRPSPVNLSMLYSEVGRLWPERAVPIPVEKDKAAVCIHGDVLPAANLQGSLQGGSFFKITLCYFHASILCRT